MKDLIKKLESKKVKKAMARFHKVCEEHDFNAYRIGCRVWQQTTGKKCTNKKHLKGIYENKMECEATLTYFLEMSIWFGVATQEQIEAFYKSIDALN